MSFNRIRMKTLAESDRRARRVLRLADKSDKVISTLLVGNNIVNILLTSLATVLFLKLDQTNGATVSTVVVTVLVLTFGEISPKTAAKQAADKIIRLFAPVLQIIVFVLTPVTILFSGLQKLLMKIFKSKEDTISEDELMTFVDEAEEDGGITKQEGDLIRSAIEFHGRDVRDILTPRVAVVAAEETESREAVASYFRESGFSRLPVYRDTIDNIVGIIHEKDFFRGAEDRPLSESITPALFIPPHVKIPALLRKLQQEKTHIAVVINEFGGTEGIVTLEDVLEELVGEIWDEHDTVVEFFRRTKENTYLVSCDADLKDFFKLFDIDEDDYDAVTVGGWAMQEVGRLPVPGDAFRYQNLSVTVTAVEERRVTEIEVVAKTPENKEE